MGAASQAHPKKVVSGLFASASSLAQASEEKGAIGWRLHLELAQARCPLIQGFQCAVAQVCRLTQALDASINSPALCEFLSAAYTLLSLSPKPSRLRFCG